MLLLSKKKEGPFLFVCLFSVIVPPNTTATSTGYKKINSISSKQGQSLSYKNSEFSSRIDDRYFRLARHQALFCPAFVACPFIFTDVLEMFGTLIQDVVQCLFITILGSLILKPRER